MLFCFEILYSSYGILEQFEYINPAFGIMITSSNFHPYFLKSFIILFPQSCSNFKLRNSKQFEVGDIYFTKSLSHKLNDKFKIYYTLNLYIDKNTLYNTINEIGKRNRMDGREGEGI